MYGDFPAKNTVCTPYIPINVWFWPTLYKNTRNTSRQRELTCACVMPSADDVSLRFHRADTSMLTPWACGASNRPTISIDHVPHTPVVQNGEVKLCIVTLFMNLLGLETGGRQKGPREHWPRAHTPVLQKRQTKLKVVCITLLATQPILLRHGNVLSAKLDMCLRAHG